MKIIYLDNAASTPVDKKVAAEMVKATQLYGNPSSYNDCGREAREYIEKARLKVARFLGAHSDEVIFTSSGTEANNLAIQGVARLNQRSNINPFDYRSGLMVSKAESIKNQNDRSKFKKSKPHIITTQIEHPSVLKPVKWLEREGFDVSYLSVDKQGFVSIAELKKTLRPETVLVSVMYANNEIGTVEPIREISEVVKSFKIKNLKPQREAVGEPTFDVLVGASALKILAAGLPLLHVDACQAAGYLPMDVHALGADLLTFNGSKIYGPKGVGVLYVRRGVRLLPIILGGGQESGLRAGTENLPAIGGLATALDRIDKKESKRLTRLRDYMIKKINDSLPEIIINGPVENQHRKSIINGRLPNNINISVPDLSSEVLLLELDKYGICAGSGSACTSHLVEPSHVLKAIEVEPRYINGAVRFSMGKQITKKDIGYVLDVLPKIVKNLKKRYRNVR